MATIIPEHINQLIQLEANVHYGEAPPPGQMPFVVVRRPSSVLLSAPHGARTYRNNEDEEWHEEDEYTAGMALLLSELCDTSMIATLWRTEDSDPNEHGEMRSAYKQALKQLVREQPILWVLDLHGAREDNPQTKLVDLGTRKKLQSFPEDNIGKLVELIQARLGNNAVSRDGIAATNPNRITAYCQEQLRIPAMQLEMKPSVRVVWRRPDSSSFAKLGPYSAPPEQIQGMLQALADFIEYLKAPS
jgi:hypothetical protein